MLSVNNIAFKEWAVVCAALAAGKQTIILRKGGIDEGCDGFRVQHGEFWLLPTRFHQDASALKPGATAGLSSSVGDPHEPQPGKFLVGLYAVVHEVFEVHDLAVLQHLSGEHILSNDTIRQRFHYRHPGLFVLVVRTFRMPQPYIVSDSPYIAGCKSWAELPKPVATFGATAVLDDAAFAERLKRIESLISSSKKSG